MIPTATSDIVDAYGASVSVCSLRFEQFGGIRVCQGPIATVRCFEDNVVVKRALTEPGLGRVLVIDGGGSLRVALAGDIVAGLALKNGWLGLIVNGCVRDVAALRELPIGIKALGSTPLPSGKTGEGELNVPVTFGGVTFIAGALAAADDDGVVTLPMPA